LTAAPWVVRARERNGDHVGTTAAQRRILHCDMDCFYAAVHMRDDPALRGRPVIVGGDPGRRGVVASASYEARAYGIHSAMPAARAARLCPAAVFIAPDFPRYRREAERIFSIYRELTPEVETVALDEAYLDVSEHLAGLGSATAVARAIRARLKAERGLTVSVGAGPNKLIAKIASDHGKPDGLVVVPPERMLAFLAPLPVGVLHGVGPSTQRALAAMGIATVADLRRRSLDELVARFRFHGRTLWGYARGRDERPLRLHAERKSLGSERTFARDLVGLGRMDAELGELARQVTAGLVKRDLQACTFRVKVRFADFTTVTRSHTLRLPTTDAHEVASLAAALLRRTEATSRSVRLLGITAGTLLEGGVRQLDLFEAGDENETAARG
jgi:DNA polymerase-4